MEILLSAKSPLGVASLKHLFVLQSGHQWPKVFKYRKKKLQLVIFKVLNGPGKEKCVNLCLTFELTVEIPKIAILVADFANINGSIDSTDVLFLSDLKEDLTSFSTWETLMTINFSARQKRGSNLIWWTKRPVSHWRLPMTSLHPMMAFRWMSRRVLVRIKQNQQL